MPLRITHQIVGPLAVLLIGLALLLTSSLTGVLDVEGCEGCRVTLPIVTKWTPRRLSAKSWDRRHKDALAMCLFVQNQHKDVREWVGHHHAMGASTIYLHDHRSEPPLRELLTDYIDSGIVQYIWWNRSWDNWNYTLHQNPQMDVFATCLRQYRHRHQFMAFLDSDEFLVLQDQSIPSVADLLQSMLAQRQFGGLSVHWRIFGSSGHKDPPPGGVLQAFTACTPRSWPGNQVVKTIVNTDYALRPFGHIFELNDPSVQLVKENWQVVNASSCPPHVSQKIAVHHYMIKSQAEFDQKIARGGGSGRRRTQNWFIKVDSESKENCSAAVGLGPYV